MSEVVAKAILTTDGKVDVEIHCKGSPPELLVLYSNMLKSVSDVLCKIWNVEEAGDGK